VEKVVVRWDHHGDEVESLIEDGKKGVAHEGCSVRVILKPMVVRHENATHTTHTTGHRQTDVL
jgi:hypothetical protein